MKKPLYPSRSEHFPYAERTFLYDDTPVMHFDAGAGPAIVLIHGMGANLTHFEHVAPRWSTRDSASAGSICPASASRASRRAPTRSVGWPAP
jgi:alpha-beta hydrolase superfamily lysophospholipase